MASNGSYNNERPSSGGDAAEYSTDPASGGFFHSDYKKWVVFKKDIKAVRTRNRMVINLHVCVATLSLYLTDQEKPIWNIAGLNLP